MATQTSLRHKLQLKKCKINGKEITLLTLDLSKCGMDKLPNEVYGLEELEVLDLAKNKNIKLSNELTELRNLKVLSLDDCDLHTVPAVVMKLPQLQTLILSNNYIFMPDEMSCLVNLTTLVLDNCNLKSLPPVVLKLSHLHSLDLSHNKRISIPDELCRLENIKVLRLRGCNMTTVPSAVLKLTQLEELDLSRNSEIDLPDEMSGLTNIRVLNLEETYIVTVPSVVWRLARLERLNLTHNRSLQTFISEIPQNTNIKHLDLSHCELRTLPPEVGRLAQLEWLDLSSNPLQTLPAEVGQLTNVKHLDLSHCQLRTLPPEVGRLTQLEWLDLSDNPLQTLPVEVGQLTNVKHLDFSKCQLDKLPPEVGKPTQLEWLDLSLNPLQTLPKEVGQLTNVKHLDFSKCQLRKLPPEVGGLTQLEWLDLSYNRSLQTLPAEVGQLTNVKHLNLSHCQMHTLPPKVWRLTQLERLNLSYNPLQMLPSEIGQLTNVRVFDLSRCELRTLPPEVGTLTNLQKLNLEDNQLSDLPQEIGQLYKLCNLNLGNTKLRSLFGIWTSHLPNNKLTRLPETICSLRNLEALNINGNNIKSLPAKFSQLTNIHELDVSGNPLVIPPTDVCNQGIKAIRQYFEELEHSEENVSAHLKVVVLGEKMAGKTSLVQTLHRGESTLTRYEDRTHCVEITQWAPDDNITFEVYDFGGHDVYHLTHQFYLTPDAMYLLIVNLHSYSCTEQCYNQAVGFWMDTLNARVPGAVVSVVGSKMDLCRPEEVKMKTRDIQKRIQLQIDIWKRHLKSMTCVSRPRPAQRLRIVGDIHSVTLKTTFFDWIFSRPSPSLVKLKNFLREIANNTEAFPTLRKVLPSTWVFFHLLLQQQDSTKMSGRHWLTKAECERLGKRAKLSPDRLEPVLSYLQQVGTILRYTDIPELKDIIFHDPPALIEIFKNLFHHDTKALFETPGVQNANYTRVQLSGFEQDLRDCGLIRKDVLTCMLPPNVNTDIVTALMQHFGLCFELKANDKTDPSKRTILYKIPWYLYKQMPRELINVWPEDVPKEQEQLQLMCDIRGFCPRGLFQRFSVRLHPLVRDKVDWKDGAMAYKQDYPILVCSKPVADDTYITIATRGMSDQARDMWGVVHPLLEVLVQLLQEWPGVLYSLHVTCAHCIKARLDNPHQYDLRDRTADDGSDVRCPRVKRTASTSANLVYRPSRFSVVTSRTSLTQMRSSQQNDYYKMTSDPRGLALIISNINFTDPSRNRPGGEKDLDKLRKICEKLKLQHEIREDLTAQEIEAAAKDVSRRDHSSYDCFVLFLLTHGDVAGVLGTDGQHVSVDSIVSSLQACQSLVGKPKIFFIQACRGVDRDPGQEHTDTTGTIDEGRSISQAGREASDGATEPTKSPPPPTSALAASVESPEAGEKTLPTASDRLVMYATVHGHVSWRNPDTGTWLIQVLADVITEHAETETLLEMLTRVNAKVADFKTINQEYKQQPEVTHTLRKKLYFFPQAAIDQNP